MDKYVAPAPSMEKNILMVRASHMGGISQWRGIAGLVGSADHQMMGFLRGARRGTASLAHGLSGPPTGGIANILAAAQGIAGTRAQRTIK